MTDPPTSTRIRLISFICTAALLFALLASTLGLASDWPQWRGPNRDGKSGETGLLQEWPEGGPPMAWRAAGLGVGYSGLSIVDGRIFTMGDLADGQYVLALKDGGGDLLWKTRVGPVHEHHSYAGPRSTPTIDGDRVYVMNTEGDVASLDRKTGEVLWQRSLTDDYDAFQMKALGMEDYRFSESPLVDGDRVIVTPGHFVALMVALDKKTGKEIWKTVGHRFGPLGAYGAGYSSAVISEAAGTRQYVQLIGRGLISVEAETGLLLWSYNRVANDIANISTPVVRGDYVFTSSGYGTGSGLVRIVRGEEVLEAEEVYFLNAKTIQNHFGGMILHGDTIFTGSGHNKGYPIAVDLMTGKVVWGPEANDGRNSAAVTYADGRLYFRYEDGRMILIEASSEAYREHGTFVIPDVEKGSYVNPVIANGKLYLREQDHLFCYDVTAPAGATGAGHSKE